MDDLYFKIPPANSVSINDRRIELFFLRLSEAHRRGEKPLLLRQIGVALVNNFTVEEVDKIFEHANWVLGAIRDNPPAPMVLPHDQKDFNEESCSDEKECGTLIR